MGLVDWFTQEIQRHPHGLRFALRWLDALAPRAVAGRAAISGKAVREVFERPDEFLMGHLNKPKLKLGDFLLGMDPGPAHSHEKPQLQAALDAVLPLFAAIVTAESEQSAQRAAQIWRQTGELDLVTQYAEPTFVLSLAHAFGLPVRGLHCAALATEPGLPTLALVIRKLGTTIASAHPAPFGLEAIANEIAQPFKRHLSDAVVAYRDGSIPSKVEPLPNGLAPLVPTGSVIGHLIAHGNFHDGDVGIVRSVGGMLSASAGYPKAFSHALHELLARPAALNAFMHAADVNDRGQLHAYVKEALRFRPVFPLLVRFCPHATSVRSDNGAVAAGATLPFFPLSAMFDPANVHQPEQFVPGRPDANYWLFGGAPRVCIGQALIMEMFLPMFRALFAAIPQLANSKPGELRYDGASMKHYVVRAA